MCLYIKTEDIQFSRKPVDPEYSLTNVSEYISRNGKAELDYAVNNLWLCRTPEMRAEIGAQGDFTCVEFR